jgi:hypothetical protein
VHVTAWTVLPVPRRRSDRAADRRADDLVRGEGLVRCLAGEQRYGGKGMARPAAELASPIVGQALVAACSCRTSPLPSMRWLGAAHRERTSRSRSRQSSAMADELSTS